MIDTRFDNGEEILRTLVVFKPSQIKKTIAAIVENEPPVSHLSIKLSDELNEEIRPIVTELMQTIKYTYRGVLDLTFYSSFRKKLPCDDFVKELEHSRYVKRQLLEFCLVWLHNSYKYLRSFK